MSVYVVTKYSRNVKYLKLIEVTRGPDKKRRQRVIKSFGRYDEAIAKDPDIVRKLKQKYHCETVAGQIENQLSEISKTVSILDSDHSSSDSQSFQTNKSIVLNYGIRALYPIWKNCLNLDYKLDYLQKKNSDSDAKFSDIAFYLTSLKIIDPSSQLCAFKDQTKYLYDPLRDVPLGDMYKTLSFLKENKDEIMFFVNNRMCQEFNRKMTMVFYDCANVYFESPYDDKQALFRLLLKNLKEQSKQEKKNLDEINEIENLSEDPDFIDKAIEELKSKVDDDNCFRMRGLSKEHRYDLPLVSIALVIDTDGIPIDFEVFPGNVSEYRTMPKVIKNMVSKYNITNTIVVADRGLNSIANLDMLNNNKLGFIVAQKVSNLRAQYEEEMLDKQGYQTWNSSTKEEIERNKELLEKTEIEADLKFKRIPFVKEGYVTLEDGSRKYKKLPCEIMFTFSKKRYARDMAQIENEEMLARKAVAEKKDMAPSFSSGWRSLVKVKKEETEKTKTKESKTQKKKDNSQYKAESIKEDVLEKRRKLAGFAAVLFKNPSTEKAAQISDEDLMNSYHQLVKIEECFRIMKTNFTIRPIFVRTKTNVIGHITVCVLALIMTRLLEIKLKNAGYKLSLNEIQEALQSTVTAVSKNGSEGLFIKNNVINNVFTQENMKSRNLAEKRMNPRTLAINHFVEDINKNKDNIDKILEAVDLLPLPTIGTAPQICKCLKLKGSYQTLIGEANSSIQSIA